MVMGIPILQMITCLVANTGFAMVESKSALGTLFRNFPALAVFVGYHLLGVYCRRGDLQPPLVVTTFGSVLVLGVKIVLFSSYVWDEGDEAG